VGTSVFQEPLFIRYGFYPTRQDQQVRHSHGDLFLGQKLFLVSQKALSL
jgi:hypothetical protein